MLPECLWGLKNLWNCMDYLESTVLKYCIIMDFSNEIVQHFPSKSTEIATVAQESTFSTLKVLMSMQIWAVESPYSICKHLGDRGYNNIYTIRFY